MRERLAGALLETARSTEVSSLHVLFPTEADARALRAAGMLERSGVQFHWRNAGYATFDDFLAALSHDKRKKIRQERRRVAEAGWSAPRDRAGASEADWDSSACSGAHTASIADVRPASSSAARRRMPAMYVFWPSRGRRSRRQDLFGGGAL